MGQFNHKTALITGAASGIGKLMGKQLLQKGLETLVIWDINEQLLNTTTEELTQQGFKVVPYLVDIMDTNAVIAAAAKVKNEVGKVDILINNGGIY